MAAPGASKVAGEVAYESKFQWLTRLGFAARGLLYILIALLVIGTGRAEDLTGAIEYVGHGAGKLLLIAIAAGLATYGLWRLSDAAFGTEHPGTKLDAAGKRIAAGGIGLVYLLLAYKTVRVILGAHAGTGTAGAQEGARDALSLPGGQLALFAVALAFLIAAGVQFWKAFKCTFLRRLQEGASAKGWVKWMGRLGYSARGVIFLVVAWLIYRAAADRDPSEAGNLKQALDVLRGPLLAPIATGLMLFGLFSLVEARFRRIHKPPVQRVEQKAKEKLAS